jgi:hypothetical protein
MNNIKKLAIFFTLIHLTACGVKVSESGKTVSDFILGSVSPLKGLISHHRPQHFQLMQNAYSAACPAGVSVNIHPLDSDGQIDFDTIIASAPLQSDTSFSIPRSKLPKLDHPTIRYMARVVGCNDRILMRPLTSALSPDGEDSVQDISYTTTLISASHNANASKKLSQVSKQQIEELINAVGSTSSEVEAFNTINSNITIASRFEQVFDSVPAVLQSAAPKVDLVAPASISENTSSEFRAVAHHWNPNYDIAYLWKINGTSISTNATWNFSPGANDQGTHTITLYVGKDDGAGDIDLNQPYTLNSFQLQIQNTVLPVAPILSLDTDQHPSSTISQTLVHLLLNTGAEQMNCQSFSALALSESAVMPSSSAAFTIECDTNFSQELTYTISPADGFKTLYLWAIDSAGVISLTPKTLTLTLDRSPPVLSFSNLASALRGGQNYLVEWNSSDVSGIAEHKLYYSINASDYTLISDGLTAQSHLWNVPAIDTSTLTFKLEAIDTIGNQSEILSSNKVIDSTPPTIAITSPAASTATQGSLTITGVCETGAQNVSVTGDISESVSTSCSGGNFTASIVLSGADGAKSVTIAQTDLVGNSSSLVRSFTKDTTPPILTQTTTPNGVYLKNNSAVIGGSCEDNLSINISGTDTASLNCNNGLWTYETESQSLDGEYTYSLRSTDLAGNQSSLVNYTWNRKTSAPVVNEVIIANGASNIFSINTVVSVRASDNTLSVTHIKIDNANPNTGDCQSIYTNTGWVAYVETPTILNHTVLPGDGPKKICAWSRDSIGNVSLISPSQGTQDVNTDTVNYDIGTIPVITEFNTTNTNAGGFFNTNNYNAGDPISIEWTIEDQEGLSSAPVSLYYTLNETTWHEITNEFGNAYGLTLYTDSFTGFTAPSSNFFRLKIIAKDKEGNKSIEAFSSPANTGNWTVFAGTTSNGIGGPANTVQLVKEIYGMGSGNFGINPKNGDVFYASAHQGIVKLDASTGYTELFITHGTSNLGNTIGLIDATTRIPISNITSFRINSKGQMILNIQGVFYNVDLETKVYKWMFGSGALNFEPYTSESIASMPTSFDLDLNDNIYFFVDCKIPGQTWNTTTLNTLKILKAIFVTASESYIFEEVAGDCTQGAVQTNGTDALSSSLGNYRYRHILNLTVNGDGSLIYFGYGDIFKIYNGNIFSTNVPIGGLYLDKNTNELWSGRFEVGLTKFTNTYVDSNNSELSHSIASSSGSAGCSLDGVNIENACISPIQGNRIGDVWVDPNSTVFFIDRGPRLRFISKSDNKVYTLLGTQALYGDGLNKNFLRAQQIRGIYYKKPSEPNQDAFPHGLYFTDAFSMTLNYINPTTNIVETIAGDQSLQEISGAAGLLFNKESSLGSQHYNRNLISLKFDSEGLPWSSVMGKVFSVNMNKEIVWKHKGTQLSWVSSAQGEDPTSRYGEYYLGQTNLEIHDNQGIFLIGNGESANPRLYGGVILYQDFNTLNTEKLIGGALLPATGFSPDTAIPGEPVNLTLSSTCGHGGRTCYVRYQENENRLYFSEDNKIRYIATPLDASQATLHTLVDLGRTVRNFIFSENNELVFYVSGGRLYCTNLPGYIAPDFCNNSNLGPSPGLRTIGESGDQLTWMSENELLINNNQGEIILFKVPSN